MSGAAVVRATDWIVSRRGFLAIASAALTLPAARARAQPTPLPVIGVLSSLSQADREQVLPPLHKGLAEAGYRDGRNVVIEYRWAEGHYDRLPTLATDLVHHRVAVIAAISGTLAALAAKAATTTIPVVFANGGDPVAHGLVDSLHRPGGNVTGVSFFSAELAPKRLELLREIVPSAGTIAIVLNRRNPQSLVEGDQLQAAARQTGQPIAFFDAGEPADIDRVFQEIAQRRMRALLVSADPVFLNERSRLVTLAARHRIATIYADREHAEAGGLLSYGGSRSDAYRQTGVYIGRVLKGEKPSTLPVMRPTRFDLLVNLKAARQLGLTVPPSVLLQASEVIE
jgi:putative ABC transport system substrate-binding protein